MVCKLWQNTECSTLPAANKLIRLPARLLVPSTISHQQAWRSRLADVLQALWVVTGIHGPYCLNCISMWRLGHRQSSRLAFCAAPSVCLFSRFSTCFRIQNKGPLDAAAQTAMHASGCHQNHLMAAVCRLAVTSDIKACQACAPGNHT